MPDQFWAFETKAVSHGGWDPGGLREQMVQVWAAVLGWAIVTPVCFPLSETVSEALVQAFQEHQGGEVPNAKHNILTKLILFA